MNLQLVTIHPQRQWRRKQSTSKHGCKQGFEWLFALSGYMITIRVNDSCFTCMLVEQQHQREIWASVFYWKIMKYYFLSGVWQIECGGTVRHNNCLWKGFNKNPPAERNQCWGNSELPWSFLTLNISAAAAFHSHSLNIQCHVYIMQ